MCANKVSYPSRKLARSALNRIRRMRRCSSEPPVREYHCPDCDEFHLTGEHESDLPKPRYKRHRYQEQK